MAKAQQKMMEIESCESKIVAKRRCAIMDRATPLDKGIKIPNPTRFMWT
jgi:hypothetical protein